MQNPKDVLVWEYAPGKKLVQFTITLKNVKGALAICSQALAQYNINLLSGFHTAPIASPMATWSFFADLTASTIRPDQISERLRSLPFVEKVETQESQNGLLVDDGHFPIRCAVGRAVLLGTQAVTEMLSRLWGLFGTGAVTIIDEMGESMGRFRAQKFVGEFGTDFVVDNLTQFLKTYTAIGFAELDVESYDQESGTLLLAAKELFECVESRTSGRSKTSVFFKGHLRGFMSAIFNAPFDVVESECVSSGAGVCRFLASRIAVQSQIVQPVREKASYDLDQKKEEREENVYATVTSTVAGAVIDVPPASH